LLKWQHMKSLNLTQPLVIMVIGNPGAGKSFFAKQFAEMFGAPIVSLNQIQDTLDVENPYKTEVQAVINKIAGIQIDELLKTSKSILLDGGCNTKTERLRLTRSAKKAGYDTLIVWVQTDEITCKQRATKRSKSSENEFVTTMSAEEFETQAKRFAAPLREDHLVISGRHTYSTQAKTVLRRLTIPREVPMQGDLNAAGDINKPSARPDVTRRSVLVS
jgi:predicted kinase